ncbi:hypothetical protein BS47DRAFT_1352662 [Hydnum rufescens UP504]|uniref:Uncharacterized protein n=1 Tax=Hydnum rufescens UP504 TaxID=1448309 RepID=A0A9P6AII0_9AGAM|nr:hypothetical protein BS47DRAFT_1352662 [Hydnum rufescens UP504]
MLLPSNSRTTLILLTSPSSNGLVTGHRIFPNTSLQPGGLVRPRTSAPNPELERRTV